MSNKQYDILSVLYPARCIVCNMALWPESKGTCAKCRSMLPVIKGNRCAKCSKPVESGVLLCSDCMKKRHVFECGFGLWSYNNVARKIIAGIKYSGRKSDINYIAAELVYHSAVYIKRWKPDGIIPVPLHKKKLRQRGFNQAKLLAVACCNLLGISCITDLLFRTRYTKPQKYFDDEERRNNLQGAFRINEEALKRYSKVRTVVLVDDIYTSGSTIDECAAVLKQCGVKKVYFLVLCIGNGY